MCRGKLTSPPRSNDRVVHVTWRRLPATVRLGGTVVNLSISLLDNVAPLDPLFLFLSASGLQSCLGHSSATLMMTMMMITSEAGRQASFHSIYLSLSLALFSFEKHRQSSKNLVQDLSSGGTPSGDAGADSFSVVVGAAHPCSSWNLLLHKGQQDDCRTPGVQDADTQLIRRLAGCHQQTQTQASQASLCSGQALGRL